MLLVRMRLARHRKAVPMDVGRAPEPVGDHARRRRFVRLAVDQDEGAGFAILGVGVVGDRHRRRDVAEADLVEVELLRRELVEIVDVDAMFDLGDRSRRGARAELQEIGAPRQHRIGAHPDDVGGELVGDLRPAFRMRENVAAGDVEFVGERQRYGVARFGAVDLLVGDEDPCDRAAAPGTGDDDRLAFLDAAARNRAGNSPKIEMRAIDPLHGKTKRRGAAVFIDLDLARDSRADAFPRTRRCAGFSTTRCRRSGPRSGRRKAC